MAEWHLDDLRNALIQKGWQIIAELPGDGRRVFTTWEIQRSTEMPSIYIDFHGGDGDLLPLSEVYVCYVRGRYPFGGLYFGKRGDKPSRRRQRWNSELKRFIESIDTILEQP